MADAPIRLSPESYDIRQVLSFRGYTYHPPEECKLSSDYVKGQAPFTTDTNEPMAVLWTPFRISPKDKATQYAAAVLNYLITETSKKSVEIVFRKPNQSTRPPPPRFVFVSNFGRDILLAINRCEGVSIPDNNSAYIAGTNAIYVKFDEGALINFTPDKPASILEVRETRRLIHAYMHALHEKLSPTGLGWHFDNKISQTTFVNYGIYQKFQRLEKKKAEKTITESEYEEYDRVSEKTEDHFTSRRAALNEAEYFAGSAEEYLSRPKGQRKETGLWKTDRPMFLLLERFFDDGGHNGNFFYYNLVQAYKDAASSYIQDKMFARAEALLSALETLENPPDSKAFISYSRGLIFEARKETALAIEAFKRALSFGGEDNTYFEHLIPLLAAELQTKPQDIADTIFAALKKDKHNKTALIHLKGLIEKHLKQDKLDSAMMLLQKAMNMGVADADFYFELALEFEKRTTDRAGSIYRHVLRLDPGYSPMKEKTTGGITQAEEEKTGGKRRGSTPSPVETSVKKVEDEKGCKIPNADYCRWDDKYKGKNKTALNGIMQPLLLFTDEDRLRGLPKNKWQGAWDDLLTLVYIRLKLEELETGNVFGVHNIKRLGLDAVVFARRFLVPWNEKPPAAVGRMLTDYFASASQPTITSEAFEELEKYKDSLGIDTERIKPRVMNVKPPGWDSYLSIPSGLMFFRQAGNRTDKYTPDAYQAGIGMGIKSPGRGFGYHPRLVVSYFPRGPSYGRFFLMPLSFSLGGRWIGLEISPLEIGMEVYQTKNGSSSGLNTGFTSVAGLGVFLLGETINARCTLTVYNPLVGCGINIDMGRLFQHVSRGMR